MKSIKGEGIANCPNGCEPFEAEFWTLIRADHDAELKEALLGGELNLISCPHCGEFFYHDRNIIYFDPSTELLAFVAPRADKENFAKIKEQMKKDFGLLKANLTSLSINYDPFYLAGLEELKLMLEYEENVILQSEVLAAQSAQRGFKLARLKPASARLKGYPYYLPVDGEDFNKNNVLAASSALTAANPALTLLTAFIKDIKGGKDLPEKI